MRWGVGKRAEGRDDDGAAEGEAEEGWEDGAAGKVLSGEEGEGRRKGENFDANWKRVYFRRSQNNRQFHIIFPLV